MDTVDAENEELDKVACQGAATLKEGLDQHET